MQSSRFNTDASPEDWPIFMSVEDARTKFASGTKIMVAIGGWGDTNGFDIAARTEDSRERFARNIAAMIRDTGADGVDIDWEYPGYELPCACCQGGETTKSFIVVMGKITSKFPTRKRHGKSRRIHCYWPPFATPSALRNLSPPLCPACHATCSPLSPKLCHPSWKRSTFSMS